MCIRDRITSDDVLTVLKEEAEEDALRLAGVGDEEITDGVITKTKRRFNWLLLNLFTAFLATYCISLFGATIEQMVVLAFLMPIVASMGGNAGMQTLAVTIRTLATNDLTKNNLFKFEILIPPSGTKSSFLDNLNKLNFIIPI